MDRLVGLISGARGIRSANDDDIADRLSSRYTVALLITFAVLISMNQYVRNPITCWAPVHFTGAHTKFATNYCWVKNTYYIPWGNEVPKGPDDKQTVPYYQWIPFILLFQAILFYLPTQIWHGLNSKSGIDADNILQAAHAISRIGEGDAQKRTMKMLSNQMDRFLSNRVERGHCSLHPKTILSYACCGRRLGNYLIMVFIASKIFYIANIFAQLFVLNKILSIRFDSFGFDLLKNMVSSDDWTESSAVAFPRVTYCDFLIRGQDLANTQTYTVQCVLPINLYNEKIYFFLWFWMVFVLVASMVSFFVWLFRFMFESDRIKFIRNHLLLGGKVGVGYGLNDRTMINKFTNGYLKQDGAFILRLIAHNTNNISTTEIICNLWQFWLDKYQMGDSKEMTPPTARLYPRGLSLDDDGIGKKV